MRSMKFSGCGASFIASSPLMSHAIIEEQQRTVNVPQRHFRPNPAFAVSIVPLA